MLRKVFNVPKRVLGGTLMRRKMNGLSDNSSQFVPKNSFVDVNKTTLGKISNEHKSSLMDIDSDQSLADEIIELKGLPKELKTDQYFLRLRELTAELNRRLHPEVQQRNIVDQENLIRRVVEETARKFKSEHHSQMGGTVTYAQFFQSLQFNSNSITFNSLMDEFIKIGKVWPVSCENPLTTLPPRNSAEKHVVQPYFTDIMEKFNKSANAENCERSVFSASPDGKWSAAVTMVDAVSITPDPHAFSTHTIGSRMPDVPCYFETLDIKGVLRVVTFVELKSRNATDGDFSPSEQGQVIDTASELLRQQPYRTFVIVCLSDGVRFKFYHVRRLVNGGFVTTISHLYLNMTGWAALNGMLMSPPAQLGFEYYDLKDYELQRVLGCGAQSTVFAVTRKGEDNTEYALKVFKDDKDHIRELNVLAQLKKDGFTVAVPLLFDDGSEVEITEIVSKKKHKGIVSMPVCKLIRPERDGELLSAKNVLSLIDVLKSLHEAEIFNCDLKPKNVLLGTDGPVICDWGSAVIGRKRVCSPGTIGFCDFAIGSKQNACAEHDLKALVRLFYACYTNQHVPSNSLFDSNAFWSVQFPVGSYWQKAMDAAGAADYDKLKSILGQF